MTIKQLRSRVGLTQRQFAEHFGLNLRTLQDWEQGRFKTPEYVFRLIERIIELESNQDVQMRNERHEND